MKKRADGLYQLSVMIGYNDNGTPKRRVVYGKTQREVSNKATELRLQYNMGIAVDSNITVGEWAQTWLKIYKSGVAFKTFQMYDGIVKNYVMQLGDLKLSKLKTVHLQNIINEHSHKYVTLKKFKQTMCQMLDQAIMNDIMIKNPAKGVKLPMLTSFREKRALSENEISSIKALRLDDKTMCFINILLYTGMRKGEALALHKNDVDKENMIINVCKTLVFKVNQSDIKDTTKTAAGVRTIPILDPLKDILFNYVDSINSELLFPTISGTTFTDTAYRRMWSKFENAIGTKEITAHIFRHNFATLLYNAGVDIKSAQAILGHKSIHVTMDIYTHLDKRKKEESASKLNTFLNTNY